MSDSDPDNQFHLFPKLPLEIRDFIWEHALPGPRLIEVSPVQNVAGGIDWVAARCVCPLRSHRRSRLPVQHVGGGINWAAARCACPPQSHRYNRLAVQHTCSEARRIAQKYRSFVPVFGTAFCWEMDTVYVGERVGTLHGSTFMMIMSREGACSKMRRLMIEISVWLNSFDAFVRDTTGWNRCSPEHMLSQLLAVEDLTFVSSKGAVREIGETRDERWWGRVPVIDKGWSAEDFTKLAEGDGSDAVLIEGHGVEDLRLMFRYLKETSKNDVLVNTVHARDDI